MTLIKWTSRIKIKFKNYIFIRIIQKITYIYILELLLVDYQKDFRAETTLILYELGSHHKRYPDNPIVPFCKTELESFDLRWLNTWRQEIDNARIFLPNLLKGKRINVYYFIDTLPDDCQLSKFRNNII